MLTEKMLNAINDQINKELASAYLYQSMMLWARSEGFKGTANWFSVQVQEETFHARKMMDYVDEQGGQVILEAIEKPDSAFADIGDVFEKTLAHEKKVTASINALVKVAREENDNATEIFLQWYVSEQVEEEASVNEILDHLKLAGKQGPGLFFIDKDLGSRSYTPPATGE